jgi:glucosamine--fructose-6-phosphate aminotransferase (isomerizing)
LMKNARGTYLIGCGTAANAALVAQYLFSRIAARHVNFAYGSEFSYLEHFIREGSLAVALSQSGETIDIVDSVNAAKDRGCTIAALVNVQGSSLYRLADFSILLQAGPERCVLATKSFTAKVAILTMAAYAADGRLGEGQRLVEQAAAEIRAMLHDERVDIIGRVAERIRDSDHLYVIGRGPSYPLALEAALKIKEVSYMHAEGFAGGELKHGVIALIEDGSPCVVLAPHDETYADIISGAMEVKARGGLIIGISPQDNEAFDLHIRVPDLGDAASLINVVPAQLLAYNLARLRGYDPDKPRNLAKSVTVK